MLVFMSGSLYVICASPVKSLERLAGVAFLGACHRRDSVLR